MFRDQVLPLAEADAMLAGTDAFHDDGAVDDTAARLQLQAGEVDIVAGLPQAAAVFRAGRSGEVGAAQFVGDGLHGLRLLGDRGRAAVKIEEQRWCPRPAWSC